MGEKQWVWLALLISWIPMECLGQGGLLVTPTRVVFEGEVRSQSITLVNRGTKSTIYRLFLVDKLMTEEGNLVDSAEVESTSSLRTLMQFSPRRVMLDPGQSQKVRLLVRRKRSLEPGEYRSHLVFQAIPSTNHSQAQSTGTQQVGIQLSPLIGASIPLIVRQGDVSAQVAVVDARLATSTDRAAPSHVLVRFQREGNASVYGDVSVQWVGPQQEPRTVGYVKGMAIYPEVHQRVLSVPVHLPELEDPNKGQLWIRYASANAGQPVLAEYRYKVP